MITYKYLIKYIALIPFHNFTTLSGKLKMVFTAIPITQMLVCSWNSFVSACKDFPKSYFLNFTVTLNIQMLVCTRNSIVSTRKDFPKSYFPTFSQ